MKKHLTYCDICEKEADIMNPDYKLQVIFTTEQTEGRAVPHPYLQIAIMDICSRCLNRVLQGEAIWAHGAQGYNTYYFKDNR